MTFERSCTACVVAILAVFGSVDRVKAQTPGTAFTYQGLLENNGMPADGPHDLRFRLWLDPLTSDSPIGPVVCKDNVAVADGLFTAELDFGSNVFLGFPLWLEIEARADATAGNCAIGAFTPLAPRQPLKPAPYAVWATTAQTAGLRLPFDGTSTAGILLHLTKTSNSANSTTGFFENYSTSNNSRGLTAIANGNSGNTYGVYGQAHSSTGVGVYGVSAGYAGVIGRSTATEFDTYGVYAESASNNGRAVYADAIATSGVTYAVYGLSRSPNGYGLFGRAMANSGPTYGVAGETVSNTGTGVYGRSLNDGVGVYGKATNTPGLHASAIGVLGEVNGNVSGSPTGVMGLGYYGVVGHSTGEFSGIGVEGRVDAPTGECYGVWGVNEASPDGYGVFSSGDLGAVGAKSFRIDHPADPTNKYLLHYATESPEVINLYSGKVTLDAAGEAVVELPAYFARINRDPRYGLTAVGAPMPMLHVAAEIDEAALHAGAVAGPGDSVATCTFRIAGGAPRQRVCWEVKALRNDLWMQRHAPPVEREKDIRSRGTYQRPELYNQPTERAVHYRPARSVKAPASE